MGLPFAARIACPALCQARLPGRKPEGCRAFGPDAWAHLAGLSGGALRDGAQAVDGAVGARRGFGAAGLLLQGARLPAARQHRLVVAAGTRWLRFRSSFALARSAT